MASSSPASPGLRQTAHLAPVYALAAIAFIAYMLRKLLKAGTRLDHLKAGYDAEMAVGQELDQLMRQGAATFHDMPAEQFNIDHVVVAAEGVLAIETKGFTKPNQGRGKVDATVARPSGSPPGRPRNRWSRPSARPPGWPSGCRVRSDRRSRCYPHLRLGPRASESFSVMSGSEPVFRQLIRHLRALNAAAEVWAPGAPYRPEGITYSQESDQTLSHPRFGPIRDFPAPAGFEHQRWSFHTKLTGGAGARLYFRAVRTDDSKAVLIGYFGAHLPCVLHPT